jgi:hypothetical protein
MKHYFETTFELGDRVYHKLPESPIGIITGIDYNLTTDTVRYYVTFDPMAGEISCLDPELSYDKTII